MDHQAVLESVNPILQEGKNFALAKSRTARLLANSTRSPPTVPRILFYFFSKLMS